LPDAGSMGEALDTTLLTPYQGTRTFVPVHVYRVRFVDPAQRQNAKTSHHGKVTGSPKMSHHGKVTESVIAVLDVMISDDERSERSTKEIPAIVLSDILCCSRSVALRNVSFKCKTSIYSS
jgi:hypothetical protein